MPCPSRDGFIPTVYGVWGHVLRGDVERGSPHVWWGSGRDDSLMEQLKHRCRSQLSIRLTSAILWMLFPSHPIPASGLMERRQSQAEQGLREDGAYFAI